MNALLGFHLFATLVFVLGSLAVGLRLVWLSTRTRERPERLLGCAILGTAVLGYGVLIAGQIVRGGPVATEQVPAAAIWLSGIGKTLHDLGVSCFFLFVLAVFRPDAKWARALAALAMAMLWGGLVWGGASGSFEREQVGSPAWWLEYVVIWTYPLWLAAESLRYWLLLRRRAALGLADPMVTNRFALWGVGSVFSALATWMASTPYYFVMTGELALVESSAPVVHVATALLGLASVSCSYLAFLPPAWYARRVRAAATG